MAYEDKKTKQQDQKQDDGTCPDSVAKDQAPQKKAFSVREFCAAYGVSRSHAYNEIKAGRLKSHNPGRRRLIGIDDADDWFDRS